MREVLALLQLRRLPRVLVLLSIIDAAGEVGVTIAISDAPTQSTPVFYLPTKAGEAKRSCWS